MSTRGITLTELIIVVLISGIITLVVPQIILQVYRFYRISRAYTELQQQARNILEQVTKDLRNAISETIIISRHTSTQPYCSKIEFRTIDNRNISYYQLNKALYRTEAGRVRLFSGPKSLVYLAFTFPQSYNLATVSVSLTLEEYVYEIKYKALHMASEKVRIAN